MTTNNVPQRLAWAFAALVRGFHYPRSEGPAPYEPFFAAFDPEEQLSLATFREAVGLAPWWQMETSTAESWFAHQIGLSEVDLADMPEDYVEDERHKSAVYAHLQRAMRATLDGPIQWTTAAADSSMEFHKTRHYFFGRVPEGGLAGLVTFSGET